MQVIRTPALLVLTVAVSAAFGVAERILQDHSAAGWYLANIASVWLTIAFAFGALASRRRQAWLLGFVAEMSALGAFYGYMHFAEHHQEPLHIVAFWTFCGLIAGPTFGLVGYAWRRLRSQIAGLTLGAMFVGEATLLDLARARPRSVTALESVAGVLLAAMLLGALRWRQRHPRTGAGGHTRGARW
jgi:uncharacterized membrane protein (UPF0136 family)